MKILASKSPKIATYNPQRIAFEYGKGVYLYDKDNNKYLDGISGIGACSLGHAHIELTNAIIEQAKKFIHCSNAFVINWQNELAEKLCPMADMDEIFLANSGTETVETAIKCIRLYGKKNKIELPKIIVAKGAFHGRSYGALSASNTRTRVGFEPHLPGFIHVPYNDIKSIEELQNDPSIVAVLVEPIQGENGVIIPHDDYIVNLRKLCDKNQWLLALDEIQTGVGRTGKLYKYMHHQILPDILMTAKGLASGVPIGACLMRGPARSLLGYGKHGSTFGGNPLACHAACTVLDVIEKDNLCSNAMSMGNFLLDEIKKFNFTSINNARGYGLMLAIEMNQPCKDVVKIGIDNNLLINVTSEKVVRILPPLIINQQECQELLEKLQKTIATWAKSIS